MVFPPAPSPGRPEEDEYSEFEIATSPIKPATSQSKIRSLFLKEAGSPKKQAGSIELVLEVEIDRQLAVAKMEANMTCYTNVVSSLLGALLHAAPPYTERMPLHLAEVDIMPVASGSSREVTRVQRSYARTGSFEVYVLVSVDRGPPSRILLHSRLNTRCSPKPKHLARRLRRLVEREEAGKRPSDEERCAKCGWNMSTCPSPCLGKRGNRHRPISDHRLVIESDNLTVLDEQGDKCEVESLPSGKHALRVKWGSKYTCCFGKEQTTSFYAAYGGPLYLNLREDDDCYSMDGSTVRPTTPPAVTLPKKMAKNPRLVALGYLEGTMTRHDFLDHLKRTTTTRALDSIISSPASSAKTISQSSEQVLRQIKCSSQQRTRLESRPVFPFRKCRMGWTDVGFDFETVQAEELLIKEAARAKTAPFSPSSSAVEGMHHLSPTKASSLPRPKSVIDYNTASRACYFSVAEPGGGGFCLGSAFGEASDGPKYSYCLS